MKLNMIQTENYYFAEFHTRKKIENFLFFRQVWYLSLYNIGFNIQCILPRKSLKQTS